ncbi:MAG: hypothetical protein J6I85_05675 [Clostridia bacterium]|nr:hypothetical protein [Clostridia bacterium]
MDSVKNTSYSSKIFRIEPGHHVYNQNTSPLYIRAKEISANNIVRYELVTNSEFTQYWGDSDITISSR